VSQIKHGLDVTMLYLVTAISDIGKGAIFACKNIMATTEKKLMKNVLELQR
jgi:hypothetical protein